MQKIDIARKVSQSTGLSIVKSGDAVDVIFKEMKKALANHEEVVIRKLGVFTVRHKRERPGRNPQNGDYALIPAKSVVSFKAGTTLKREVSDAN